jgi:dTDP-4-dehydrorhamnose 3,5-epimerase
MPRRGHPPTVTPRPEKTPAPSPGGLSRTLIDGVRVKPLSNVVDERGRLFEILRNDEALFLKFGQVYCTTVEFGVVKGWHYHKRQVDNFVCVSGMIKLALYDGREGSPTRGVINELFLGVHQPQLVQIPAQVHHGFKGISQPEAVIINVSTEPYNYAEPDEYRFDPHHNEIPYEWDRVDR